MCPGGSGTYQSREECSKWALQECIPEPRSASFYILWASSCRQDKNEVVYKCRFYSFRVKLSVMILADDSFIYVPI